MEAKLCEKFSISCLRQYQVDTINSLLKKKDAFVSKKTGAGKSMCYQGFSTAHGGKTTVIVISPLISIMEEQCAALNDIGIKSIMLSKMDSYVIQDNVEYVFSSPELLLGENDCRNMLKTMSSKDRIGLMAVDEAHLVLQWGESSDEEAAFRPWYSKLAELRSLCPGVPLLALTATANKAHRMKIQKKLLMKKPFEVLDNPDRANVKLFTLKRLSTVPLPEIFLWLIELLKSPNNGRTLVFTKSIDDTAKLYNMCVMDGNLDMKTIEMFHSMTPEDVKTKIRVDMCSDYEEGRIKVLFCTNAAGLGVNYKNVDSVINFGPPQDMDTFLQHIGRAGRTGEQAMHLLLYTARQLRNLTPDMLDYVHNTEHCRREIQLKHYLAAPDESRVRHLCCDICAKTCQCGVDKCENELVHPAIQMMLDEESFDEQEQKHFHLEDEQRDAIQFALELHAEKMQASENEQFLEPLNKSVIENIVEKVEFIKTPDDLLEKCYILSYGVAVEIFQLIRSVLEETSTFDMECDDFVGNDDV